MIHSFRCRNTEKLYKDQVVRQFQQIERIARRKLAMLDAVTEIDDLRVPPANRLEKLKGEREGQYSIRINKQWRICFEWNNGHAYNVEILDYH